jgi:hypothetical protein
MTSTQKEGVLAKYGLPIIAAVIGSSLLLSIITMVISEVNKPNIRIYVEQRTSQPNPENDSDKNYYEVIARNDGRTPATNLKLSMFFFATVKDVQVLLNSSNYILTIANNTQPSAIAIRVANLTQNEMIAARVWYEWTNTTKFDPYYISATYKEGSAQYPVFRPVDIESGRLPNIIIGRSETTLVDQILIASSIISIIAFITAAAHRKVKEKYDRISKKSLVEVTKEADLFLIIPLTILSAIFVFYCFESLPRSFLIPTLIPVLLDVTTGPPLNATAGIYDGIEYRQGELLGAAFLFVILSAIARTIVSYLIAKKIITKLGGGTFRHTRNFFIDSLLIMGAPISSIFILFFSQSLYSIPTVYFFTIFLVIDMIRMLILVLIVPKIHLKSNKPLYFILGAITIVGSVVSLLLFALVNKVVRTGFQPLDLGYHNIFGFITNNISDNIPLYQYIMYFALISGLMQLIRVAIPKFRKRSTLWTIPAVTLSLLLIAAWIIIIYDITATQSTILNVGLPIISVGLITILLEIAYSGITLIVRRLPDKPWKRLKYTSSGRLA